MPFDSWCKRCTAVSQYDMSQEWSLSYNLGHKFTAARQHIASQLGHCSGITHITHTDAALFLTTNSKRKPFNRAQLCENSIVSHPGHDSHQALHTLGLTTLPSLYITSRAKPSQPNLNLEHNPASHGKGNGTTGTNAKNSEASLPDAPSALAHSSFAA